MTYSEKKDQFCDKLLRRFIVFLVVAAFAIPLLTPRVFAASTVSISGGDQVKGGETFTVTVTYSGSQIGSVDGSMTYDTSKLNYLSGGSSSGNTGYIQLREIGSGSISFQIKFQAIGDGSTTLKVDTSEMYDTSDNALDRPSASKTVKVIGSASSDDVIKETQAETQEATATEETMESGVDEKGDEGEMTGGYLFLIISAAVLAVIIAVIAAVLIKKRGGKGKGPKGPNGSNRAGGFSEKIAADRENMDNKNYDPSAKAAEQRREANADTMMFQPERREGLIDDRLNGGLDEMQHDQYVEPEYADEWDPNPAADPQEARYRSFDETQVLQPDDGWQQPQDNWNQPDSEWSEQPQDDWNQPETRWTPEIRPQQEQPAEPAWQPQERQPEPEQPAVSRNTRMFRKEEFERELSNWEDQEDRWPDDDKW